MLILERGGELGYDRRQPGFRHDGRCRGTQRVTVGHPVIFTAFLTTHLSSFVEASIAHDRVSLPAALTLPLLVSYYQVLVVNEQRK